MTRKEWTAIREAAEMLDLGDEATLSEIKKAYRRLSKKYHPDVREKKKEKTEKAEMHELTEAYHVLLDYCAQYSFPLIPGDDEELDGEDWWFERFGRDHHWGKSGMTDEDTEK